MKNSPQSHVSSALYSDAGWVVGRGDKCRMLLLADELTGVGRAVDSSGVKAFILIEWIESSAKSSARQWWTSRCLWSSFIPSKADVTAYTSTCRPPSALARPSAGVEKTIETGRASQCAS